MKMNTLLPELQKRFGRSKKLFITLSYITLATLGIYFVYQRCRPVFIEDGIKYTRNICGGIRSAERLPKQTKQEGQDKKNEKKVDAKVFKNSKANYWEIIDTAQTPNFPTGLKFYEGDMVSPTVARWKNYLLGINLERYINESSGAFLGSRASEHYTLQKYIRTIRVYNLDTGETFDISLDKPTWGEIWYATSQVVDDTYYFGVGGDFGPSLGYKLELPPQRNSRITKLPFTIGEKIEKVGNIYVSSFCYEGCTYSLFNPATLTTTSLERMTNASNNRIYNRKEEFIGIDSQGRMILNVRNVSENAKNNQQTFDTIMLAAVPLNNESVTIPLIEADKLPKDVHKFFMIDGIDKVLTFADSKAYIYDINQNSLREVQTGSNLMEYLADKGSSSGISYTKTDEAICFVDTETVNSAISLTKEKYLDTPPGDCKKLYSEKSYEEMFKGLNLPDNFRLLYTQMTFKTYNIVEGMPESKLPDDSEILK